MNGFEYSAAIHMIMNGLVEEGMTCVEAIRAATTASGATRGTSSSAATTTARSMASYALLNAFSGFQFDLVHGHVGFAPVRTREGHFRCFWSLGTGWGEVVLAPGEAAVRVAVGQLDLRSLALPLGSDEVVGSVELDGRAVAFEQRGGHLQFSAMQRIAAGGGLRVVWKT